MPMSDNTNGSLIMTTNSGERSSFSTPFISEFNDIQNKYWQYFELVIANNDYKENKNNIEFKVRIQDKDYNSEENFNKAVELYFHYNENYSANILEVNYYNNGVNVTQTKTTYTLNTIVSNYITVLGFLINPTSYEIQDPVFEEYDNERYFTMTLFVNYRLQLSNEIKIPVSLTNNWSITLDTDRSTDETSNVVYQWNFDNSRFIYKDLAYQCYEDLTTLYTVSDFKYLPTHFNLPREVSNQGSEMIVIFPFATNINEDFTKMKLELVCNGNINDDSYMIILGDFKPNTSFLQLQLEEIKDTEVGEALEITIDTVKDTFTIDYVENGSRINLASINISEFYNLLNGMFVISIILDTTTRKMYFNAKSGLTELGYDNMSDGFGPFYKSDETYFKQLDFDLDHLNFIKKSLVLWSTIEGNNYAINFGTKPYYLVFDDIESIEDIYNSPNNIYWKSLFQYNYTYPFSKPFLNNPYILPYDFSDRNNNIYMEVSIENKVQDVTYYIYIGSGYKVNDNGIYDEQALLLDEYTGFLVTIKNTHLMIYRYYNGAQEIASNYELINDTIAFEFIENLTSSFNFGYNVDDRYTFANFNIFIDNVRSDLKSVVLHAIPDDHSLTDLGSIRINFGPDGLYARYLDEIKEYDSYNKSFNYDIDNNDLTLLMYIWQLGFYGNKTTDEEWFTVANTYYLESNAPEYWSLKFINPTTFGKKVFGYGVNNEVIGGYESDYIDENYTSYPNDTEPQENMNMSNVYYTQPLDLVNSLDNFYMEIDIIDNNDALYTQNSEAGTTEIEAYNIEFYFGRATIKEKSYGPNNEYPEISYTDSDKTPTITFDRTNYGNFSITISTTDIYIDYSIPYSDSVNKSNFTIGFGLKDGKPTIYTDIAGTWTEHTFDKSLDPISIDQSEESNIGVSFSSDIPGYLVQQYTDNLELRVKFWNFSHRDTASIYYPILATS